MLEQLLPGSPSAPRRGCNAQGARWMAWIAGSIAVHAIVFGALAAVLPSRHHVSRPIPVEMTFVKGTPVLRPGAPPPPGRAPLPSPPRRAVAHHPPKPVRVPVAREVALPSTPAVVSRPEPPAAPDPGPTPVEEDGGGGGASAITDGARGGVNGGSADGVPGGAVALEATTPAFDARSMTRPVYVSGPSPQYTRKAIDREVEGVMVVRCTVATDGAVRGCDVLEGLPYLDDAVVSALQGRRYQPATRDGRPVEVKYVFRLHMKMPR